MLRRKGRKGTRKTACDNFVEERDIYEIKFEKYSEWHHYFELN